MAGSGSGDPGKVPPRPGSRPRSGSRPAPSNPAGGARPANRPAPARASARQVAQRRRQRGIMMAAGSAGLVVVVVAVILVVVAAGGGGGKKPPNQTVNGEFALAGSVTQEDVAKVESVPLGKLIAAAVAADNTRPTIQADPLQKLPAGAPATKQDGKPELLYMGGEFCPFCAVERWSMVMALAKFGTFSGLMGTSSSSTDQNPSTPTFSFYGSTYTSKYLSFVPVEMYKNTSNQAALQAPTAEEGALLNKYDTSSGIPFIYVAGRYFVVGPQYQAPDLSGQSWDSVAQNLAAGNSTSAKGAQAAAGFLVGDLCAITHGQPGAVCSQLPSGLVGVTTSSPKITVSSKTKAPTTTSATTKASK